MNLVEEVFGCGNQYTNEDVYGLELEIEDQRALRLNGFHVDGWNMIEDGSLRNNGMEFITVPPVKVGDVEARLEDLFKAVKISKNSYSDRTSIHVHCNMQGEKLDTLKSFCLLYLVTERAFFNYVEQERFENVFCVPLMDFAAPFGLFNVLNKGSLGRNWAKYSALNLLPLSELGTVEFRHMHGTSDVKKIVTWVKAIDLLKQSARKKSFEEWRAQITQLNTTSEYGMFLMEIFGELEIAFLGNNHPFDYYKEMLYANIMQAKLWEYAELKEKAQPPIIIKTKKAPIEATWNPVGIAVDGLAQLTSAVRRDRDAGAAAAGARGVYFGLPTEVGANPQTLGRGRYIIQDDVTHFVEDDTF